MAVGGFRQHRQQNAASRQEEGLGLCSGGDSSSGSSSSNSRPGNTGRGRGSPNRRQQRADLRRGGWNTRSKTAFQGGGLLGGLTALFSASSSSSSSPQGDGDDFDGAIEEAVEPQAMAVGAAAEASSLAAAAAKAVAATSGDGVFGSPSTSSAGDRSGAIDAGADGEDGGAVLVGPGISWATLSFVVASQLAFVGLFGWISSSTIRE